MQDGRIACATLCGNVPPTASKDSTQSCDTSSIVSTKALTINAKLVINKAAKPTPVPIPKEENKIKEFIISKIKKIKETNPKEDVEKETNKEENEELENNQLSMFQETISENINEAEKENSESKNELKEKFEKIKTISKEK